MKSDILIRIAHREKGTGVFYARLDDYVSIEFSDEMENFLRGERHPPPRYDALLVSNTLLKYKSRDFDAMGFFRYGFASIKQLRNWFYTDGIIREMDKSGFCIVEMTGDVTHGHTQAVIDSRTITKKESFSILDYLGIINVDKSI